MALVRNVSLEVTYGLAGFLTDHMHGDKLKVLGENESTSFAQRVPPARETSSLQVTFTGQFLGIPKVM